MELLAAMMVVTAILYVGNRIENALWEIADRIKRKDDASEA